MSGFVSDEKQARRFFVSGMVQGVGYRFFAQEAGERLRLGGYVRNLHDGRVEVYAIGPLDRLALLREALERGPRGAFVDHVEEEIAGADPRYENDFSITYDR